MFLWINASVVTDGLDSGFFPQLKALWVLLVWEQEDRTPPLHYQL